MDKNKVKKQCRICKNYRITDTIAYCNLYKIEMSSDDLCDKYDDIKKEQVLENL